MGHSTYVANSGTVALSASATKSLVIVTPATLDFLVTEIGASFDANTAGQGVKVDLYRVASGTAQTGSAYTPVKINNQDGLAATATALQTITAEPTTVTVLKSWYVAPACGLLVIQFPLGREPIGTKTSTWPIGLRVTTPSGVTPNAQAYIEFEE